MHIFSELLPTKNQENFKKNYMGWEIIANKGLLLIKGASSNKFSTFDGITLPLKVSFHTNFPNCILQCRGYWVIYRGPGFLADV
jgi:hypothetical protein